MEFRAAVTAAVDALEPYLRHAESGQGPAVVLPALGAVSESLELRRWISEGGMDAVALGRFLESYLLLTTRVGHPAELAHQVAVPDVPAAIGDLVHGITNNPMGIYEMGPAAATIEDWATMSPVAMTWHTTRGSCCAHTKRSAARMSRRPTSSAFVPTATTTTSCSCAIG
jgi:hypothetical protein